jgi:hypothetical protein
LARNVMKESDAKIPEPLSDNRLRELSLA